MPSLLKTHVNISDSIRQPGLYPAQAYPQPRASQMTPANFPQKRHPNLIGQLTLVFCGWWLWSLDSGSESWSS